MRSTLYDRLGFDPEALQSEVDALFESSYAELVYQYFELANVSLEEFNQNATKAIELADYA